jgi:cell division protein ZapA
MPLVNVMVNNRAYTIACDEGEEEHLKELAAHVDAKTREVLSSVGQVGDSRVILMAALLIADEHHDALRKSAPAAVPAGNGKTASAEQAEVAERAAADALEAAAKKVEDIAARLVRA